MKYRAVLKNSKGLKISAVECNSIKYLDTLIWSAANAVGAREGEFTVEVTTVTEGDYEITVAQAAHGMQYGYNIMHVFYTEPEATEEGFGSYQEALGAAEAIVRMKNYGA